MDIKDDVVKSWAKFLNPKILRNNLIAFGLFIASFEMFKQTVLERPKIFYLNGFDENGYIVDENYDKNVLSKDKSPLRASFLWLQEMGAINEEDIITFRNIIDHRNEIAHELPDFLTTESKNMDIQMFQQLLELFSKVEKWWIMNVEAGIAPENFPNDFNEDDVVPGSILAIQLMADIALGNEPEDGYYYKEIANMCKKQPKA